MILSGTTLSFIGVFALLAAALLLAYLDKREKGKGNVQQSRFLSRMALALFLLAFVGGVVATLLNGIKPREESPAMQGMMGNPNTGEGEGGGMPPMAGGMGGIGKIDEAEVKRLQEKAANDPKDVTSRERLGHIYLQQQDFENVFRLAHEALQINPKSVESKVHMGMVLFAMQEMDQALAQFDQALSIDPKNLEALLFQGIVRFQGKEDLKGSKESWQKYLKLAPPNDKNRGRVKMFLDMTGS